MAVAGLVTWLITATGGFILLGTWISKGGHRPGGSSRLSPGQVLGHFSLAVITVVLVLLTALGVGGS